ncbi:MAG: cob(I)yrinic acid a,c-diamide adenosyltransferase [Candidatus Dadabacteria bacterium]|nr:MAG: cob(I)yrinic acid a,c-diamide adenosyltransferase [Candidatus Dadabacteria bacterium]
MVKINKIYTRNGDGGETHLVGGELVAKDSLRVKAYGEIDELNSHLGLIRTLEEKTKKKDLLDMLSKIQNELFDLGSELATPPGASWDGMLRISDEHVSRLENWIDSLMNGIEELRSFVLPGGSKINANLHIARSVCRRAERSIIELSRSEEVSDSVLAYVNRLSDLLFAMARFESKRSGAAEYLWEPGKE